MIALADLAPQARFASDIAGAVLAVGATLYVLRFGDRARADWRALLIACGAIALWCVMSIVAYAQGPSVEIAATVRNLALIGLIFCLFAADGRDESLKPTRPLVAALVVVQLCQLVLLALTAPFGAGVGMAFEIGVLLQMLISIGALVLLHNLYAGAAAGSRDLIRRSAIGLAGLFAYDLNLATIAWLGGEFPVVLTILHSVFAGGMAAIMAFGANNAAASRQFRPSRTVAFQTLSLLLIGSYIVLMVVATRSVALLGGDIARTAQALLLVLAILVALVWLPSQRLREHLRVLAAKHLFQHRYDYREEWLRFTRTIGRGSNQDASFPERAIKAIADITESPGGLLLTPDESASLELTARWNWPTIEVPGLASEHALSGLLERRNHIVDLDEARAGIDHCGELEHVPQWLLDAQDAWALVPLIHFDRLVGAIVLARPRVERRLDWEDFDLLRVVGRQLASYLAEQAGQHALMEASRFDEFNRRMAFVMHDIKNLASQLSLLSANAQKHADNPEFRADMLITIRSSSEKLSGLLARLGRYEALPRQELQQVEMVTFASALIERFRSIHPVELTHGEPVMVLAHSGNLEQALTHLIQNAIDASEAESPVMLSVEGETLGARIQIIDSGKGMSPEFVRTGLFKPFVSSKEDGFGIGAMEAREMIRAMNGTISVESREGIGTRFEVMIPRAEFDRDRMKQSAPAQERAA
ncbi:MAG: XrtA/PEP-CTERM system histidine kinase PrsK [Erythrobacter sp.]